MARRLTTETLGPKSESGVSGSAAAAARASLLRIDIFCSFFFFDAGGFGAGFDASGCRLAAAAAVPPLLALSPFCWCDATAAGFAYATG